MAGRNGRLILISVAGLAALFMVTLVAAQSTSTATVEVRVWRNVEDPERLHLSTRPADGRWVTHNTPLDMSELSDSERWHQSSIIAIDVEVPAAVAGPELSQLFGIEDSQRCSDVVAFVAEHFAEYVSVYSCEAFEFGETLFVGGVVVHYGQNTAFTGVWSEAAGLTGLGWTEMYTHPLFPPHCFDVVDRIRETYGPVEGWNCMTRTFVENIDGDAGDPAVVWELVGWTVDSTGGRLGFAAHYLDGVGEPRDLEVYGAQLSRFHGIDDTPECEGVVAFVAEHFAETTSITSCEGQAQGAGSLRGLLMHRGEAGYFDGTWSETDGITGLYWTVLVTYPSTAAQCAAVSNWLAEHTGLTPGVCQFAEASLRWDGGPFLAWVVRGILIGSAGATDERPFEAWASDGEARPLIFKVHAPAEWEYPPAE